MTTHRRAAILSIGDELTLGQNLDTNSRWLADRLLSFGIVTIEHATVPDDLGAITHAFERLSSTADLVLSTGGLGPTDDDLTRQSLARLLSEELVQDAEALAALRAWYTFRYREMPATNLVQALRPTSATCLPNPHGTAPGLALTAPTGALVCALPGPPREMQPMFEDHVRPRLRPPPGLVRTRFLRTVGLGESAIAERFAHHPSGNLMSRERNPLVGTTASGGIVTCRIRFESATPCNEDAVAHTLDDLERDIRSMLEPAVFATGDATLEQTIVELLTERRETCATAESCTGGMIAQRITSVPGASRAFLGGLVTYANEMKIAHLGVAEGVLAEHGAVSAPVALAMARGALSATGATHALAVTGIAGPDGGTPEKPVGTVWIALASRAAHGANAHARRFLFRGSRDAIREWSALAALAMLRLALVERDMALLGEVERQPPSPLPR
ncbi:MAG: competence/damage-inducible protein A [Phycisphaerales bacterium]|jgi:nicotinamide-nucleotide amidase|nr:competence/damage-inducible protein A [Phycisphaerales bacterium]